MCRQFRLHDGQLLEMSGIEIMLKQAMKQADRDRQLASWVRYCEQHSVYAMVDEPNDCVLVTVPWTHLESGLQGSDSIRCATFEQVKAALGY